MKRYLVTYLEEDEDTELLFCCMADDSEHAREQCVNAYPRATIIWAEPEWPRKLLRA